MTDSKLQFASSAPPRELPVWTTNRKLVETHPELHHYTTRRGLEGILKTNTLWATHFSNLSDSSEIKLLKEPLIEVLDEPVKHAIIRNQRDSLSLRRFLQRNGGASAYARECVRAFVDANYTVAFTGGKDRALAEPFVCSFCSHANDHRYEQANGLLSQWRGYGGEGRFALVFDTLKLDDLLAREWQAHFWIKLELAEVIYLKGHETVEARFPKLLKEAITIMSNMPEEPSNPGEDFLKEFFQAATLLKHQGFQEEREIRIVAIPHSREALADRGKENYLLGWPPNKEVRTVAESKKYVALFESLDTNLPIKRIIVGPGANQTDDIEFANSLVSDRVPISNSETPFIG